MPVRPAAKRSGARLKAGSFMTVVLAIGACDPGQDIKNPSGDCGTGADGQRHGFHAAGNATWVPDCQNKLLREYWRAFTEDGKSAYLIPRPDGASELQPICTDFQHELGALVERYQLCATASTGAAVAVVNDIDLADALRIVHFLHGQLRFSVNSAGSDIRPFPIPSDIVDACNLGPSMNSPDLEAICERERARLVSGIGIGYSYAGPGAVQLVARLNELYGIP